jgi:hypothetical protein
MSGPERKIAAVLCMLFLTLVALGLSGSSFNLELQQSSGLIHAQQQTFAGTSRSIRSDEWLVFTPLAIAQFNHAPRFPIVNRNLGPDGQNMLVVGMPGVPVAHISALAKPAIWGFFVFNLRHALAWYWWLPVFGSLFAVWSVMGVLAPGRWGLNLATAGIFVSSAYVVAWSNWPAYTVLFPATAFWAFVGVLKSRSWIAALALGVVLGLSLAGFVFVLYPPWQVSVGYLFLFITAGVIARDRLWRDLDVSHAAALGVAVLIFGLLVAAWWSDAKEAIHVLQSTVYPGQRTTITGGDMTWWGLLRGYVNNFTLYYQGSTGSNQSELSSFVYLFPLAVFAVLVGSVRKIRPGWPEVALIVFCLLLLWFQFIGIPPRLAEWTLWGRVQPKRTDLALGLGSIMLCSLSMVSTSKPPSMKRIEAVIAAVAWTSLVLVILKRTPGNMLEQLPFSVWLLTLFPLFLLSYWLLSKDVRSFLLGSLFVTCSMALPFNPLIRAPKSVQPAEGVLTQAKMDGQRILVVGSQVEAMGLLSAGLAVANGVFYYPQPSLWKQLDPDSKSSLLTNRYQHLSYVAGKMDGEAYRIESPRPDIVHVLFDSAIFDFRLTTAQLVLAPVHVDLSENPTVRLVESGPRYNFYRVL